MCKNLKAASDDPDAEGRNTGRFRTDSCGKRPYYGIGRKRAKVHIKHGEMLDKEGNFYCENIAPSKQEVEYILSGEGTETYLPRFTFQDFRYIKILEFPGEPTTDCFEAEVWSSFDEETGMFRCSDEKINQLYRNTKWSQRGNFIDVPIAGPQRTERLGWTGDAQIFAKTACYHMDVRRFYKKWLNDLRTEQFSTGAVRGWCQCIRGRRI